MELEEIHPIMAYGLRQSEAIACLRTAGHKQATVVLLFAAIDQLAWLADDEEVVGNEGFTSWVQRYMLDKNPQLLAGVTAADLWGARCGVLHTGAPESNWYRGGKARRIFYSSNMGPIKPSEPNVLVLSLERLGLALAAGLTCFQDDLRSDAAADARVRTKLGRMLVDKPPEQA